MLVDDPCFDAIEFRAIEERFEEDVIISVMFEISGSGMFEDVGEEFMYAVRDEGPYWMFKALVEDLYDEVSMEADKTLISFNPVLPLIHPDMRGIEALEEHL